MALRQTVAANEMHKCVSRTTIDHIRDRAKRIQRKAKTLSRTKQDDFDNLILRDIRRNAAIAEAYQATFRLATHGAAEGTIQELIDASFGKGAFRRLEDVLKPKNFPHDTIHRMYELTHDTYSAAADEDLILTSRQAPYPEIKKRLREELNKSLEAISQFYTDTSVLQEVSRFVFDFAPPGTKFSFCDEAMLSAALDPARLVAYTHDGTNVHFLTPYVHLIGAHELGHGLNRILSRRTMPRGLAPPNSEFTPLVHGRDSEGTALVVEDFMLNWMEANRERLQLSEQDLEIGRAIFDAYVPHKLQQVVYSLYQADEWRSRFKKGEKEKDGDKMLARLTGMALPVFDKYAYDSSELPDPIQQVGYFFGQRTGRKLARDMAEQGVPDDVAMSALMAGVWCSQKAQRKFIFEHYLPRVLK